MRSTRLFLLFSLLSPKIFALGSPPQCYGGELRPGTACQQIVTLDTPCEKACGSIGIPHGPFDNDEERTCYCENIRPDINSSMEEHYKKLIVKIKEQVDPTSAPYYTYRNNPPHKIYLAPYYMRITDINEKEQSVSVMMITEMRWTDPRLTWNKSEYGGITAIHLTRDTVWRPPVFPSPFTLFITDDMNKANVLKDSEWEVIEEMERVPHGSDLIYKITVKRYPYFWINLIIIPCFILGSLAIAALSIGGDSHSVESLVNIGLAASVSSAVVVSTMTDDFPKTKEVPSLATFVQNQIFIIFTVLITLSVRKAVIHKFDAAIEKFQKTEKNEEISGRRKMLIMIVKVVKHRLFYFILFEIIYAICFAVMMRHLNLNF